METLKASDGTLIHYDGVTATVEKPKKEGVLWQPEECGGYFCLTHSDFGQFTWRNVLQRNNDVFIRQQLFKTLEEAQAADKKRIAEMKVKRWIAERNEGEIDWKNNAFFNIVWDTKDDCFAVRTESRYKIQFNDYCIKDRYTAAQLLEELPEETMLVFGPEA